MSTVIGPSPGISGRGVTMARCRRSADTGKDDAGRLREATRERARGQDHATRADRPKGRLDRRDRLAVRDDARRGRPEEEGRGARLREAVCHLVRRHPAVQGAVGGGGDVRPQPREPVPRLVAGQVLRVVHAEAAVARDETLHGRRPALSAGDEQPSIAPDPDVPAGEADPLGERPVEVDARENEGCVVGLIPLGAKAGDGLARGEPGELATSFEHDDREPGPAQEEGVARTGDPSADDDHVRARRQGARR